MNTHPPRSSFSSSSAEANQIEDEYENEDDKNNTVEIQRPKTAGL